MKRKRGEREESSKRDKKDRISPSFDNFFPGTSVIAQVCGKWTVGEIHHVRKALPSFMFANTRFRSEYDEGIHSSK